MDSQTYKILTRFLPVILVEKINEYVNGWVKWYHKGQFQHVLSDIKAINKQYNPPQYTGCIEYANCSDPWYHERCMCFY